MNDRNISRIIPIIFINKGPSGLYEGVLTVRRGRTRFQYDAHFGTNPQL